MLDENIPPDPEKVREYMFEAISAMGPRIFRPDQAAHAAYGEEAKPPRPLMIIVTAFLAGAVTGVAVSAARERRRHR